MNLWSIRPLACQDHRRIRVVNAGFGHDGYDGFSNDEVGLVGRCKRVRDEG